MDELLNQLHRVRQLCECRTLDRLSHDPEVYGTLALTGLGFMEGRKESTAVFSTYPRSFEKKMAELLQYQPMPLNLS